jgi:hypothetical protein
VLARERARHAQLAGASGIEAEQVAVELVRRQGRRESDGRTAATDHRAEVATRVLAQEPQTRVPAVEHQAAGESLASALGERQRVEESEHLEVEAHERILGAEAAGLATVLEVVDEGAVEPRPQRPQLVAREVTLDRPVRRAGREAFGDGALDQARQIERERREGDSERSGIDRCDGVGGAARRA